MPLEATTRYSIHPDVNIFTVYTGLTASGYDLARSETIYNVIRRILDHQWPQRVLDYFRRARNNNLGINPYWPRAYLLAFSSLYISDPLSYTSQVTKRIEEMDINPSDKGSDTISWLMELPEVCAIVRGQSVFDYVWEFFLNSLDISQYEQEAFKALSSVMNHIEVKPEQLPEIIIVPNPLQSPEITDFVDINDILYVISSQPDSSSIIHEVLHRVFSPFLQSCREIIRRFFYLFEPVRDRMINIQYAWTDDLPSWNRVFEENLVRATVIWIVYQDDQYAMRKAADYQSSFGFIYIPTIVKQLMKRRMLLEDFTSFIEECLWECKIES